MSSVVQNGCHIFCFVDGCHGWCLARVSLWSPPFLLFGDANLCVFLVSWHVHVPCCFLEEYGFWEDVLLGEVSQEIVLAPDTSALSLYDCGCLICVGWCGCCTYVCARQCQLVFCAQAVVGEDWVVNVRFGAGCRTGISSPLLHLHSSVSSAV